MQDPIHVRAICLLDHFCLTLILETLGVGYFLECYSLLPTPPSLLEAEDPGWDAGSNLPPFPGKPGIVQLVEHLTVDTCSNQMVPGSIPGGRTLLLTLRINTH